MAFLKHEPQKSTHSSNQFIRFDAKGGVYVSALLATEIGKDSVVDLYWDENNKRVGIKYGTTYRVLPSRGHRGNPASATRFAAPQFLADTNIQTERYSMVWDTAWNGWVSSNGPQS